MLSQAEIRFIHEISPSVLFHHENAFKVYFVQGMLNNFHQQKYTKSLWLIRIDEWKHLHSFLLRWNLMIL
jgi:hypothetical protein